MRLNKPNQNTKVTHEGAPAFGHTTPEQQLTRSVMSCFLWEDEFYEDGVSIADRILEAAKACDPDFVALTAAKARNDGNLRHAPLLLLNALAETGKGKPHLVADAVVSVIKRADELTELLSIYWRNGKKPLPAQFKKGLARSFCNFDAYKLAKYNRKDAVKLRDVMRMVRPTPRTPEQAETFGKLLAGTLESPDTWEVALSAGADKKETFERLIREQNLGYLALLRNLRNMEQAGVDPILVREAILARRGGANKVLPFRFVAAAIAAPQFEPQLDAALQATIKELPTLAGKTIVLCDTSGSMNCPLSKKSDMTREVAAAALASIINGDVRVFVFADTVSEVPPRKGMAGVDVITKTHVGGGTRLGEAVHQMNTLPHDRLIVITDEQSHSRVPDPVAKHAYMINVGSYQNGVGYGAWTHIDGFSENVLKFIHESERPTWNE